MNSANSVNFISNPPSNVSVNQIFKVEVSVKINGGTPLPNAKVSWNVTKAINLKEITAEIFTALGNTNYNIQKSNLLALSSKLDKDRTSGYTGLNGIAKIYLRIKESPLDSKVAIVCQCDKAVSPLSTTISVFHPIRKITFDKNYEETVKVNFNKNEDGYLSKFKLIECYRYKRNFRHIYSKKYFIYSSKNLRKLKILQFIFIFDNHGFLNLQYIKISRVDIIIFKFFKGIFNLH